MNRIKEIRECNNLKQADLAKHLQVSQGTLSNWERGAHDPDNESLSKLADYFKVSTDYLLGRTNNPKGVAEEINIDTLEFALYGEARELDEEDKAELLRNARRMRELMELKKKQKGK